MAASDYVYIGGLVAGGIGTLIWGQHSMIQRLFDQKIADLKESMKEEFDGIRSVLAVHSRHIHRSQLDLASLRGELRGKGCIHGSEHMEEETRLNCIAPPHHSDHN